MMNESNSNNKNKTALNAKAPEFVPGSFGSKPAANASVPKGIYINHRTQSQNDYNNCNNDLTNSNVVMPQDQLQYYAAPQFQMSPAQEAHIYQMQVAAAHQGLMYDPASNAMYAFMNGVPVCMIPTTALPPFPVLPAGMEGEMVAENVTEESEVLETSEAVGEVPSEEPALVEEPKAESNNSADTAAAPDAAAPVAPIVEQLTKEASLLTIDTAEAAFVESHNEQAADPNVGSGGNLGAADVEYCINATNNTSNISGGGKTISMHHQQQQGWTFPTFPTSMTPNASPDAWKIVNSNKKKKKAAATSLNLGSLVTPRLASRSFFSPELLADAEGDGEGEGDDSPVASLAAAHSSPSTPINIAASTPTSTSTPISTPISTPTSTFTNTNSNSINIDGMGIVGDNIDAALAKEERLSDLEAHQVSRESSNAGDNSVVDSKDSFDPAMMDPFFCSTSIAANRADTAENAENSGDLHGSLAQSPSVSFDGAESDVDDNNSNNNNNNMMDSLEDSDVVDYDYGEEEGVEEDEGMDGQVVEDEEEQHQDCQGDDSEGNDDYYDEDYEGHFECNRTLDLHLAAQAAADSNEEDDEGYVEYTGPHDLALARLIAEQAAASYDDEELYRQYDMHHKPTISPSILNSSLPEDKLVELVNNAEHLANTHRLFGFYQDDREDTQRKINLNYVRKKEKRHTVSYVPGHECTIRCAFCSKTFLLRLSKNNGKEYVKPDNLYKHCAKHHLSRNAVGQEMVTALGERVDTNPPAPTMARTEPGMVMRPSTTMAGKISTTNIISNKSSHTLCIAEEINTEKYIPLRQEYTDIMGISQYSEMWTDPDDDEAGREATHLARERASIDGIPLVELMMHEADPKLLQDASSEGDAEEDGDTLVDDTTDVDAFTIKSKIVKALDAMKANGTNPRRTAAQIVMDSSAYKTLPGERRLNVEALMLQIHDNRMHTKPKDKPLQCLNAFLSAMELHTLSVVPDSQLAKTATVPAASTPKWTPPAEYAGTFAEESRRVIFRRPRDNCNTYAQDIWSYLCELQNHDASTDPSVVIDMAYHVTRCAFMLHKHEATGHLPPDVMSALDAALDLSVEPKPGSYHPPHPIDSIEFAKIFDLGPSAKARTSLQKVEKPTSMMESRPAAREPAAEAPVSAVTPADNISSTNDAPITVDHTGGDGCGATVSSGQRGGGDMTAVPKAKKPNLSIFVPPKSAAAMEQERSPGTASPCPVRSPLRQGVH